MKRLLIAFAAAATTFVASAWNYNEWFDQSTGASWSTNVWDADEGAYVIDADVVTPVALTPSVDAPDTNTFTKVAVSAKITPAALESFEDGPGNDAQTALIAAFDEGGNNVSTNYYAWIGGEWVALSGAMPNDGTSSIDLTITFDYTLETPKVNFLVGETALTTNGVEWIELTGVNSRAVSQVAFAGSGSVTSVDAEVGLGVASVDGIKYPTYSAAIAASTESEPALPVYILRTDSYEGSFAELYPGYELDENNVMTKKADTVMVVSNDETTTNKYWSLDVALANATATDSVVLLANNEENITIASGKTLNLVEGDFTFSGTFDGSGTVAMMAKPKDVGAARFANTWTGTFQVCWDEGNNRFVFSDFGNADSKVEIVGANSVFSAFPCSAWTGGTIPSGILPGLVLTANWTVNEGYNNSTTTFASLTGTGNLTLQGTANGTDPITYHFNTITNFTGTLGGGVRTRGVFEAGNIFNDAPDFDVCLVKLDANGKYNGPSQVNGLDRALCAGTVNGQRGVYYARATVDGDGYVTVAEAIAAAEVGCVNSVVVLDGSSAAFDDWTLDNGVYTYANRAYIGKTGYATLAAAVAAAGESEVTIDLVKNINETVTVPANVTVAVADDVEILGGTLSGAGRFYYTKVPSKFRFAFNNWTGTVTLDYADVVANKDLAQQIVAYGDANSVVEIGPNGTVSGTSYLESDLVTTLKVSGYVSIDNGSSYTKRTFPRITGDGVLVFGSSGGRVNYAVNELVDWNGVVTNSSTAAFVTNIVSGMGAVVYNVASPKVVVGEDFDGQIVYNNTPSAAPEVNADSECEVCLNFNYNTMNIANYGGANSTIVLGNLSGNNTYLPDIDMVSKVVVAGDVTINNGNPLVTQSVNWSALRVIQMPYLKVDGSLKLEKETISGSGSKTWNSGYYAHYYAETLDAAGIGTIEVGNQFALRVDAVDFATAPSGDSVLVPITLTMNGDAVNAGLLYGPNGVAGENIPVTVNGEATEQSLVYDAEKGGLVLYVPPTPAVASINGQPYSTLEAAIADAQDGNTIVLLSNITLDARVEPNLGSGTALTFDLGGYTITRTGTSGNGSVFDVKSGNVVITNGVIDCTQDDTAIVAYGVYAITARSGANITLDGLTVTVDSQAGACVYPFAGATVTILGGTYGNNTAVAYQYHANWTGMAVNQANISQQLITISGGRFFKVDPALGDDSWADGAGTFLAEGYESTQDGDYWVVSEKTSEPVTPGEDDGETYTSEEDAAAAAAMIEIGATDEVETAVGAAGLDAYLAKFEGKVVDVGTGNFKVVVGLTEAAAADLAADATTNVMATVAASLPDIVADATGEQTEVTVSNVEPGFYYSISYGTSLEAMTTEGVRVLAPASGTIMLTTPAKVENATAGFYKVNVNLTDK